MKGQPISTSSDVYSAGIVLWEIMSRKEPFEDQDTGDMADLVRDISKRKMRPPVPKDCPPEVKDMCQMSTCVQYAEAEVDFIGTD
jgi:serine/threonine protein kinase